MREFLMDNCYLTLEECQLVMSHIEILVYIGFMTLFFYLIFDFLGPLLLNLLAKGIKKLIKLVNKKKREC